MGDFFIRTLQKASFNGGVASDKLQVSGSQFRRTLEDGNDAAIAKAFVCSIFVEVKTAFLLVIKEVDIQPGKFLLDDSFVFASSKGGSAIDANAFGIDLSW